MRLPSRYVLLTGITLLGLGVSCATVAPAQLVAAREAYSRTSAGPAARWTPMELADGKKMLDRADGEFEERGDTTAVRDYAYIAERKFELAEVRARSELDRQRIAEATALGISVRDAQAQQSQEALDRTRGQLQRERSANDTAAMVLQAARTQEDDAQRAGQPGPPPRLSRALQDLGAVASVREEPRGVVITVDTGLLFALDRATLLVSARPRLDQIAEALKDQGPRRRMVVEAHTDTLGPQARTLPLSQARAGAIRDYLISRGLAPEQLLAIGLGSSRPLVDNSTPRNRATNRRVEIVIQGGGLSSLDRPSYPSPEH